MIWVFFHFNCAIQSNKVTEDVPVLNYVTLLHCYAVMWLENNGSFFFFDTLKDTDQGNTGVL